MSKEKTEVLKRSVSGIKTFPPTHNMRVFLAAVAMTLVTFGSAGTDHNVTSNNSLISSPGMKVSGNALHLFFVLAVPSSMENLF